MSAGVLVRDNDREMAILKELLAMTEVGICTMKQANKASALVCRDISQFGKDMSVSDAADMALDLVTSS